MSITASRNRTMGNTPCFGTRYLVPIGKCQPKIAILVLVVKDSADTKTHQ
jgi:hypothetical protein